MGVLINCGFSLLSVIKALIEPVESLLIVSLPTESFAGFLLGGGSGAHCQNPFNVGSQNFLKHDLQRRRITIIYLYYVKNIEFSYFQNIHLDLLSLKKVIFINSTMNIWYKLLSKMKKNHRKLRLYIPIGFHLWIRLEFKDGSSSTGSPLLII